MKYNLNCFTEAGCKLFLERDKDYNDIRKSCFVILNLFFFKVSEHFYLTQDMTIFNDSEYLLFSNEVKEYHELMKEVMPWLDNILNNEEQRKIFSVAVEICNRRYLNEWKLFIERKDGKIKFQTQKISK